MTNGIVLLEHVNLQGMFTEIEMDEFQSSARLGGVFDKLFSKIETTAYFQARFMTGLSGLPLAVEYFIYNGHLYRSKNYMKTNPEAYGDCAFRYYRLCQKAKINTRLLICIATLKLNNSLDLVVSMAFDHGGSKCVR